MNDFQVMESKLNNSMRENQVQQENITRLKEYVLNEKFPDFVKEL